MIPIVLNRPPRVRLKSWGSMVCSGLFSLLFCFVVVYMPEQINLLNQTTHAHQRALKGVDDQLNRLKQEQRYDDAKAAYKNDYVKYYRSDLLSMWSQVLKYWPNPSKMDQFSWSRDDLAMTGSSVDMGAINQFVSQLSQACMGWQFNLVDIHQVENGAYYFSIKGQRIHKHEVGHVSSS